MDDFDPRNPLNLPRPPEALQPYEDDESGTPLVRWLVAALTFGAVVACTALTAEYIGPVPQGTEQPIAP